MKIRQLVANYMGRAKIVYKVAASLRHSEHGVWHDFYASDGEHHMNVHDTSTHRQLDASWLLAHTWKLLLIVPSSACCPRCACCAP